MLTFERLKKTKELIGKFGVDVRLVRNTRPIDFTSNPNPHPVEISHLVQKKPCLISVDIKNVLHMEWCAFQLGKQSKSPFVKTLLDYSSGAHVSYDGSVLECFYKLYQPLSASDTIGIGKLKNSTLQHAKPYAAPLPWDNYTIEQKEKIRIEISKREAKSFGSKSQSPKYLCDTMLGPLLPSRGELEFSRLVSVFKSVKKNGFNVNKDGFNNVQSICLYDCANDSWKYFIYSGHHRAAALSALGYDKITVQLNPYGFGYIVRKKDSCFFPVVSHQYLTLKEAELYFERIMNAVQPKIMEGYLSYLDSRKVSART